MGGRAAELLFGDFLMGHDLDHVGTGDEHVRALIHHEDEIGDGRRIHRAARARAHHRGNLRNHSGSQRVAQENIGVTGQRHHAFLDARPAGIIQANHRRSHAHGHIHQLADLCRVGLRQRTTKDGEILGEDKHQPAFHAAVTGHKTIAGNLLLRHAEIGAAVRNQSVGLFECTLIEQELDAFAGRHLSLAVLALPALAPATGLGGGIAALELSEFLFKIHDLEL